jgi:predicted metal-dependent hydrolase
MMRAKKSCRKLWHIHAVEELDGMDFAFGIFKLEAKGSNTLDLQTASDTSYCGSI